MSTAPFDGDGIEATKDGIEARRVGIMVPHSSYEAGRLPPERVTPGLRPGVVCAGDGTWPADR
jgi:hypothetical protein